MRDFSPSGLFLYVTKPFPNTVRRGGISLCGVLFLSCSLSAIFAAESNRVRFSLPAEAAELALKRFSVQSGLEVLFGTDTAANVKTKAVTGEFLPKEAIDRMLAGTPLRADQDEKTGAMKVSRAGDPNAHRAAPAPTGDRPNKALPRSTQTILNL